MRQKLIEESVEILKEGLEKQLEFLAVLVYNESHDQTKAERRRTQESIRRADAGIWRCGDPQSRRDLCGLAGRYDSRGARGDHARLERVWPDRRAQASQAPRHHAMTSICIERTVPNEFTV